MSTRPVGFKVGTLVIVAVAVWGLTGWGTAAWGGESKVLQGMVAYRGPEPIPNRVVPDIEDAPPLTTAEFPVGAQRPVLQDNPISSVPQYFWWYGCSPTSAGMVVGWWDGQPGRENLYKKGDAQVWSGDGTTGTKRMVASQGHIDQTGGHNTAGCASVADSLACFMETDPISGGTWYDAIAPGLKAFVEWDDASGYDMKDYYPAETAMFEVPYWNPDPNVPDPNKMFCYADLKAQIDINRPVLVDLLTALDPNTWLGHTVVAYGYQDDMFQVTVPVQDGSDVTVTVGGFAVMDTWYPGTGGSEWVRLDPSAWVLPVIDANDVEWWPFIEFQGSSWVGLDPGPYDWMVSEGITLNVIPEPTVLILLGLGSIALLAKRRRV